MERWKEDDKQKICKSEFFSCIQQFLHSDLIGQIRRDKSSNYTFEDRDGGDQGSMVQADSIIGAIVYLLSPPHAPGSEKYETPWVFRLPDLQADVPSWFQFRDALALLPDPGFSSIGHDDGALLALKAAQSVKASSSLVDQNEVVAAYLFGFVGSQLLTKDLKNILGSGKFFQLRVELIFYDGIMKSSCQIEGWLLRGGDAGAYMSASRLAIANASPAYVCSRVIGMQVFIQENDRSYMGMWYTGDVASWSVWVANPSTPHVSIKACTCNYEVNGGSKKMALSWLQLKISSSIHSRLSHRVSRQHTLFPCFDLWAWLEQVGVVLFLIDGRCLVSLRFAEVVVVAYGNWVDYQQWRST